MTKEIKLDAKAKFNALQNAKHIFAFKEEGVEFKILDIIITDENCKAVVVDNDGEVQGLYTDSVSAKAALQEVMAVFGKEQPFIRINTRETKKGQTVYYVEVV